MEAIIYQRGNSYFLAIEDRTYEVPNLQGPAPSLVNEIRLHKAKLMHKGRTLSVFHPQDLERRLSDADTRIVQSQASVSIFNPPAEPSSTRFLQAVA